MQNWKTQVLRLHMEEGTPLREALKVNDFEISLLIIERDTCQFKASQIDALLNKIGKAKGFEDAANEDRPSEAKAELAAAKEETFTILKFEAQQGVKLGEFDVAHKASNLEDKWQSAYNILRASNATIKDRYHGEDYQYSYWLYGEDRIYRQKLKPKT